MSPPMVNSNHHRPPIPTWNKDSSPSKTPTISSAHPKSSSVPSVPINLSLSEDERSPNNRAGSDSLQSPNLSRTSTGYGRAGSPIEEADMLYEYFPLSVDDWYVSLAVYNYEFDFCFLNLITALKTVA